MSSRTTIMKMCDLSIKDNRKEILKTNKNPKTEAQFGEQNLK